MISIIAAIAKNGIIGNNNSLPWNLPVDMKYFRNTTMGHTIVMGRRNYEDIGKALPGRRNIVLTRNRNFLADNCEIAHSIDEIMRMIDKKDETFIIGGAEIYLSFLPYADKLYITHIDVDIDGDVVFPDYNTREWELESEETHAVDSKNSLSCRFSIYRHRG